MTEINQNYLLKKERTLKYWKLPAPDKRTKIHSSGNSLPSKRVIQISYYAFAIT